MLSELRMQKQSYGTRGPHSAVPLPRAAGELTLACGQLTTPTTLSLSWCAKYGMSPSVPPVGDSRVEKKKGPVYGGLERAEHAGNNKLPMTDSIIGYTRRSGPVRSGPGLGGLVGVCLIGYVRNVRSYDISPAKRAGGILFC